MPLPVIPALFRELAAERERLKVSRKKFAERTGHSERTIERWEQLEHLPLKADGDDVGGDLARAVDAYAEISDKSPFQLWSAALKRAERERKSYEAWLGTSKPRPPHPLREPSQRTRRAVDEIRRQTEKPPAR